MLEKLVPIPPEFYDDHKDDDLITGKGTIFPFAVFLYFMQWAAFLGFILFYWYHPSSQVTQSKMENNYDYGKASGWNCTPSIGSSRWRRPITSSRWPGPASVQAVTSSAGGQSCWSTTSEW